MTFRKKHASTILLYLYLVVTPDTSQLCIPVARESVLLISMAASSIVRLLSSDTSSDRFCAMGLGAETPRAYCKHTERAPGERGPQSLAE